MNNEHPLFAQIKAAVSDAACGFHGEVGSAAAREMALNKVSNEAADRIVRLLPSVSTEQSIEDAARRIGWSEAMNCLPWHFIVNKVAQMSQIQSDGGRPKKVPTESIKQLEALINLDLGPVDKRLLSAGGEVLDLLIKKNKDYGDDNLRKFGRFGILVRVADKVERLKNLLETKTAAVVSESERDTWMDIAGYAIQAIRLMDEEPSKPK